MNSVRKAFIIGAGFSKSFCKSIPAINDLTDLLFDEKLQPNTIYPELCGFIRNYYQKSSYSENIHNIENISTAILSKRIFKNDSEKHRYEILRYQILKIIHDKIKEHSVTNVNEKETLKRFVHLFKLDIGNCLISFNYDLILESTDEWFTYGVINEYPSSTIIKRLDHPIELIKLHGSFNWFRAKGTTQQDIHNIYKVEVNDPEYQIHVDDVPVFIPMAHTKDSFLNGSLFNTLWAKASNALKCSDEIYFLGYSFPETDLSNLFYFLDYKEKIKNIVIFDDENSNNFKRLAKIFSRDVLIKCDAKEFILRNIDNWD